MTDPGARGFPIDYEPRLVEEAVLAALRGRREAAECRAGCEALYAIADPEERDAAFRRLHAAWFERLGLGEPILEALREQPSVPAGTTRCLVVFALSRRDEGAELLVAGGGTPGRTVLLQLRPESLTELHRLRALLRRELLHVADMLDPGFGYAPWTPEPGCLPVSLFRERYRVLWDVLVDGRLARLGWASAGVRAERLREFVATFPMLGERAETSFGRFFGGTAHTHADLVAFATAPERALGRARRGPHAGERCPLCGCPTHAFEPEPDRLPRAVRERIGRSFPAWRPADGLCRQCADLFAGAEVAP